MASPTFRAVVRQGRGWLPLIGTAALLGSLTTLALPTVLGRAVDAVVAGGATGDWLTAACILIAVGVLCDLVDAYADAACVAGSTAWLRRRLVRRILTAGPDGTRHLDTGDLVSRVSANAVDAGRAGPVAVTAVAAVLPPAGSLVLLAVIDPWLAVAFLAGVVAVVLVLAGFSRRTTELSQAYAETQGRIAALLTESLAGIRTIAAAGTIDRERDRVLEPLPELHRQGLRTWHTLARSGAQAAVVGPLVLVSVLAAGGLLLVGGRITAGDLFAAGQYAALGAGLGSLTGVLAELARARAGCRRADEIAVLEPLRYGTTEPAPGPGRLDLVAVAVDGADGPLLAEVNLSLPGGATVAVVGASGAGKSVLAALVARLRDPDRGQVLLDGVPLPALGHDALRTAVGVAFERPALFGTTVADAIGPGTTDRDRIVEAARATHAHEFVSLLPAGYDTPLVEAPLSGGEAQRVGLARAWHADRLLLLDDATSSLDTATEMQIS
ncbi:MAG: ABC transporter ATP-binding protein/permease, partial [Actinomycetota bacterium]|nr:ABC transporter ATP-binding protein/permease [Actinomycetota bacterium]